MKLEEIAQKYGWHDYYDMQTGYTYLLGDFMVLLQKDTAGCNELNIPVQQDGELIGYAKMKNLN